jgi:hypothetical protein
MCSAANDLTAFELHYQLTLNQQIRYELPQQRSVFIKNLHRVLLLHVETRLAQSVSKCILRDLFEVSMTMVKVKSPLAIAYGDL